MREIKPPKASVHVLQGKERNLEPDIQAVCDDLLKLANDIERIAYKTKWPQWSIDQANSMREYCKQLKR